MLGQCRDSYPDELVELRNIFDLPEDFLNDLSDIDERPRVGRNDGWNCIVLRIPVAGDDIPFATRATASKFGVKKHVY